jgi:hypothetical protein
MRDQASILDALILTAEKVLALRGPNDVDYISGLLHDVQLWETRPAPDGRVIHGYTVLLATALSIAAHALRSSGADSARSYFRVIGVLLPDVRADFAAALEQRKRPTA